MLGAFEGAVVNVNSGRFVAGMDLYRDSQLNMTGGRVGGFLMAWEGSNVNINGGTIDFLSARTESVVHISEAEFEGPLGGNLSATGGEVHFFGTKFTLCGQRLNDLEVGQPVTIEQRNVKLGGRFVRGTEFRFDLNDDHTVFKDYFSHSSVTTVTLVHSPGDYNGDKFVDDADLIVWQEALQSGSLAADGNYDRVVDEADREVWRKNYGISYAGIPEPTTLAYSIALVCLVRLRLRCIGIR